MFYYEILDSIYYHNLIDEILKFLIIFFKVVEKRCSIGTSFNNLFLDYKFYKLI